MAPLFEARGVVKRYRMGAVDVPALRGVDLAIEAGELVALAGPSGSGKSTLLHLLGALDQADEGTVAFEGADFARLDERARTLVRRRSLGFVFQAFHLVPVLTALENVELPLWLDGVSDRERRARAREALAAVGLAERMAHKPGELSGGEQQRVAIARALVHRPRAILADEPTGDLDSANAASIVDLLAELNRRSGTTIVLATHDPAVIERTDRRVRMRDGRVVADERDPRAGAAA